MTVVLLFCVAITSSRHFPLIALSVGRVVTRLARRLDFTQARNVRVGVVRVHESGHHLHMHVVCTWCSISSIIGNMMVCTK
jgi:diadenosine tetraphosphate (Ap4A) HIT family hydrolase